MSDFQQRLQVELPSPSKIFTPLVTTFLVLYIIGYALFCHAQDFTISFLALSTGGLMSGKVWQLATYSFVNGCGWNVLFDVVILLFLGSMLERQWKGGPLVGLWLASTLICGVVWVAVNFLFGWSYLGVGGPFSYAIIAAFGVQFRKQKMHIYFWTLEAQFAAIFLIAAGLVINIAMPIAWIFIAGGAAVGYFYVKMRQGGSLGGSRRAKVKEHAVRSKGFVDLD